MLMNAGGTTVHLEPDVRHQSISAAELVVTNIKQQLIDRRLRAGDRLPPETELCAAFGVGRSSLREAIRTLRAQGLLELQPGVGTFVSDGRGKAFRDTLFYNLCLADPALEEIEELRKILEIDVMELIIRNYDSNAPERALLHENISELSTLAATGCDSETLLANDMDFHKIMADACKNHVIRSIYRSLIDYLQRSMVNSYTEQSIERVLESHRTLLTVIDNRIIDHVAESVDFSLAPWRTQALRT